MRTRRDKVVFFASYLRLAMAVGLLWWIALGASLAALSLAGTGIGVYFLAAKLAPETALMHAVFIGFAALTMLHNMLIDRFASNACAADPTADSLP